MSSATFDAIKHPRKGGSADTGNPGHFAAKILTEADPEVDLNFLCDADGEFTYDTAVDLQPQEHSPAQSADSFVLDFLDEPAEQTLGFGMVPARPVDPDPMFGSLRESEMHEFVQSKARKLAADYDNVDAETLISEAVISYMSAVRNVSATTGADKPVSAVASNPAKARGFLFNAMKNIARREAFGTAGHDMKGHRELAKAIAAETQATGVQPSSARVDELAEQVRMSFEPRRRPSIGFHRKVRTVSLDATTDSGAAPVRTEAERRLSEQVAVPIASDFSPGSVGEQVSVQLEAATGTAITSARAEAVRSAWDIVREGTDAPAVALDSLSESQAAEVRKNLAAAGGVRAALRAWDTADDDNPAVTLVLTPFGSNMTDDDRCAVMDVLAQRPAYAPDLMDAAITTATVTRKKDR